MSDWTVDTLKELFETVLDERDKAIGIQSTELERRLNALNHAHERAVEVQHTYVTEEKFEDFVKRFEENTRTTSEALTLARGNSEGLSQGAKWTLTAGGFILTLLTIATLVTQLGK